MAKSLDELLRLKGVIASGEFAENGRLIAFRSNGTPLPDDVALLTAQFSAAISQLLGVLAAAHSRISGFNWVPQQGWAYSGGDLTVAVGGGRGVFVKTAEADFNQLFEALSGSRQLVEAGGRLIVAPLPPDRPRAKDVNMNPAHHHRIGVVPVEGFPDCRFSAGCPMEAVLSA